MSILSNFKDTLENISPLNIYLEYDNIPLESKGNSFVTVGINSEECSYSLQDSPNYFAKDKISFNVRIIMPKTINPSTLDGYFNLYILNALIKSNDFNILSIKKDTPKYTKYLDKMELFIKILVECINTFN